MRKTYGRDHNRDREEHEYNGKTRNGFSLAKKDIFGQEGKDDAA